MGEEILVGAGGLVGTRLYLVEEITGGCDFSEWWKTNER